MSMPEANRRAALLAASLEGVGWQVCEGQGNVIDIVAPDGQAWSVEVSNRPFSPLAEGEVPQWPS